MNDGPKEKQQQIRVLYLFNGERGTTLEKVKKGENPGDGFWGMLRLPRYDIFADYVELERSFPSRTVLFLRKHLNIYFIHVPLFSKFFSYDIVFTSTAFGSQLLYTLLTYLGVRRPLWVMHDFSITSLIGNRRTFRQKIMHFITARSAGIITLGKQETEKLEAMFPHLKGSIEYITFGADPEFFQPNGTPRIPQIFAAGFDPDRDWETLIAACEGLNVPLVLATRPERVARFQPLPPWVTQKQLTVHDLAAEYTRSQVVVLPLDTSTGVNDAMGCSTLFEMMMSGCAIVATDTHTMRSYITDSENGLLVPEGDVGAMHAAIQRVLDDADLRTRLETNARAYALEYLDSEKLTEKLATFFKKIHKRATRS